MLTSSESNLLPHLLLRTLAGDYLDLIKMRAFVPFVAEDELIGYKAKIVEMVFDPGRISEVNGRFEAVGYLIPEKMNVIAVNEGGTILVWGGPNCVFWLRKGEPMNEDWEANIAFHDLGDLTQRFRIKNKKVEIEEMMARLKKPSTRKRRG